MTSNKLTHTLIPFSKPKEVADLCVEVSLLHEGPLWLLEYKVVGLSSESKLIWPPLTLNERQMALWESTCMEAFFMYEDGSYEEWNFSPTGAWNCYSFTSYRTPQKLVEKPVEVPTLKNSEEGVLKVSLERRPDPKYFNLTSVIEVKTNGDKSIYYLAKGHPKDQADFHHKSCFSPLA